MHLERYCLLAFIATAGCTAHDARLPAGTAGATGRPAAAIEDDGPWFVDHDCQLCHQIDQRTIGPAYRDIANRYAGADGATIDTLTAHVIEGSAGRWGDMPMTPHPGLAERDVRAMVQRILLLANAR